MRRFLIPGVLCLFAGALAAPAFADAPVRPVWVFFAERPLAGAELEAAIDAAAARLPAAVVARRLRAGGPPAGPGDLPLDAAALAAAQGTGAVLRHASKWLNAASFDATPAQERRLRDLPGVRRVQPVARARGSRPVELRPLAAGPGADKGTAALDYGYNLAAMTQAGFVAAHAAGLSGRGVTVGLLDTGFRTTHEALYRLPVLDTWDFVNGDPVVDDEAGDPVGSRNHGTVVLSVLAANRPGRLLGPAPGVAVVLAKTEDVSQEVPAEEDAWVAGLEWLESRGVDLVTSSLAYEDWYTFADLDGQTAVTTVAADQAVARGLVVINAAGNSRTTTGTLAAPADGFGVITVGAVDAAGATAWFSSPGPTADGRTKPDVAALGVATPAVSPFDGFGYLAANGTSLSTPLVAGAAALVLERAPGLTPAQVAAALRETAGQAAAPDNDQGWGLIDAWAAARHWGPVFDHPPLADREDTAGPYTAAVFVTAAHGLDDASLQLYWRADDGSWQAEPVVPTGGGPVSYFATIPGQAAGTRVEYFLTGADLAGVTVTDPVRAPGRVHVFTVGPDTTPPVLVHRPLPDHTLYAWPPVVRCTAADNLGLAAVELSWRINGGAWQGPAPLAAAGDDAWSLPFPLPVGDLADGDVVGYRVVARDLAAAANTTTSGEHAFTVRALARADTLLAESPGLVIPDGSVPGLTRILSLQPGAAGTILSVQVGITITHPAPEQLLIELYAPDGTVVRLHDHGGAGTSDLAGTWPLDLAVSGPGSLQDLVGRAAAGPWVLAVSDDQPGDLGFLDGWSLALTLTPGVSATDDMPAAPLLGDLAGAPNPFNPRTDLVFSLARPARAVLAVYDIRGMLVRRLLDRELRAGAHRAAWDGRDRAGRAVASGVYVARLEAGGVVRERKLTLVR